MILPAKKYFFLNEKVTALLHKQVKSIFSPWNLTTLYSWSTKIYKEILDWSSL